mmetsp:Transcript_3801/g.11796  ORF Transcript_3801/g.11796 Transcript_3801/m.11796 type:complete len:81 (-) Transcript_3801:10-252(-)
MTMLKLLMVVVPAAAFVAAPTSASTSRVAPLSAYVPDGLTPAQWAAMQKKEKEQKAKKNFGQAGARGFKSRSMQSFVEAL